MYIVRTYVDTDVSKAAIVVIYTQMYAVDCRWNALNGGRKIYRYLSLSWVVPLLALPQTSVVSLICEEAQQVRHPISKRKPQLSSTEES